MCGICNGFQALIKLGLVPYGKIIDTDVNSPTLTFNTISRHQSKLVRLRIASNKSPWLSATNVGDIYTTNCLETAGAKGVETTMTDVEVGDILKINANGFLAADGTSDIQFEVVKVYTLPDGQDAVKVMRIK